VHSHGTLALSRLAPANEKNKKRCVDNMAVIGEQEQEQEREQEGSAADL
jgi:hypothetical protein